MSNIVGGAVGAAGVAVLGPAVGLVHGTKNAGVLGGVIGLGGEALMLEIKRMRIGACSVLLIHVLCVTT